VKTGETGCRLLLTNAHVATSPEMDGRASRQAGRDATGVPRHVLVREINAGLRATLADSCAEAPATPAYASMGASSSLPHTAHES
jgi:hypothetical protein